MKRGYNFRLDPKLIQQVDKLGNNRTAIVTDALQKYIQPSIQQDYNVELVYILNREVEDLRNDKHYLQERLDALLIVKTPLLSRVIERLRGSWEEKP